MGFFETGSGVVLFRLGGSLSLFETGSGVRDLGFVLLLLPFKVRLGLLGRFPGLVSGILLPVRRFREFCLVLLDLGLQPLGGFLLQRL